MLGARQLIHRMMIIIFLSTSFAAPAFGDGGDPSSYPWWTPNQTHEDARLLVQKIVWEKCLKVKKRNHADRVEAVLWNQAPSQADEVRLGLQFHMGGRARRDSPWDVTLGIGRRKDKEPYKKSLAVSIIPYIEARGKKHHLLPHNIFTKEKFNSYLPACETKVYQTKFRSVEHYYPTTLLTPSGSSSRPDLFAIFRGRSSERKYDLTQPLSIRYGDLPRRMDHLLRTIWKRAVIPQGGFINLKTDENSATFMIRPAGFDRLVDVRGLPRERTCQLEPREIMQESGSAQSEIERPNDEQRRTEEQDATDPEDAQTEDIPPAEGPQIEDITPREDPREVPEETGRRFSFTFSNTLRESLGRVESFQEYINLSSDCSLEAIEDMRFQVECPSDTSEVTLNIDGFRNIALTGASSEDQEIRDSDLIAEVTIENSSRYAYRFSPRQGETVDIPARGTQVLALPVEAIRDSLDFTIVEFTENDCDASVEIAITDILSERTVRIPSPCWDVASWPVAWGNPINLSRFNCGRQSYADNGALRTLTCIKDRVPTSLRLTWGEGWEAHTIQRNEDTRPDLSGDLRPRWPFTNIRDPWLVPAGSRGSDECANEPRFWLEQLTYKGAVTSSALNADSVLDSRSLPTLQEVGWPRDQPLPEEVLITLQQAGPRSLRFKQSHRIFWRIADFERRRGSLTETYEGELRTSYPIHAPDSRPLRPYSNSLKFYAFEDRETCENSSSYSDLAREFRFYVREELQAMSASRCSYGRLVKDATYEVESPCVRAQLTEDSNEIDFQFELPSACPGERRLLIISLAQEIDGQIGGNTIKRQILEAFSEILNGDDIPAFNLITLGAGTNLNIVLDCERLPLMRSSGGRDSLQGRIDQIRFAGINLRSLNDLNQVSRYFRGTPVSKVLYLTSSRDLLNKAAEDIDLSEFNAATYWYSQGIEFSVLTAQPETCPLWQGEPRAVSCRAWTRDTELKTILKNFLTE